MTIRSLDIQTDRSYKDRLRLAFYLYVFLVIFEGAFRKWIFPGASNAFLIARDPIALYVLYVGLKRGLLNGFYPKFFLLFSIINFLLSLVVGNMNLMVSLYGFRIYGIHFVDMFILSQVITKFDIYKLSKLILYTSFLMAAIVFLQYFSPQSAWINRSTGGTEGIGFGGVNDYFRPSGTFSFISGLSFFILLDCACFFYYIFQEDFINNKRYHRYFILACSFALILLLALSLSRGTIARCALVFIFVLLYSFTRNKYQARIIGYLILFVVLFSILYAKVEFFQISINNLMDRFTTASESEGNFVSGSIGNRYGGSILRAFFDTQNYSGREIPFWGFGMGSASSIGVRLLHITTGRSVGIAEEEWSLVICEYGMLMGSLLLILGRTLFPILYGLKALRYAKKYKTMLPAFFIVPFAYSIFIASLSQSTVLGFTVVITVIFLSTFKQKERYNI